MTDIDKWAYQQTNKLIDEVCGAYEKFSFHRVFTLIYNFCTVQMSSIYMDVLKDRMYCEKRNSVLRRSAQTVMYKTLDGLVRLSAPILAYTSQQAWEAMKHKSEPVECIHLGELPAADKDFDYKAEQNKWDKLMGLRDEVLRQLEGLRQNEQIASNQEAQVIISTDDTELIDILEQFGCEQFAALCIVSEVKLEKSSSAELVKAQKSSYNKCQRCWNYWASVGADVEHPDLCSRCGEVMKAN